MNILTKTGTFALLCMLLVGHQIGLAGENPTITANEVDQVFKALSEGKWGRVESLTKDLTQRQSPAQANLIGRLRYIYIYSVLKQIDGKKLTFKDIKNKLQLAEGKLIVQPWHPIKHDGSTCFNQICRPSDKPNNLFTAQTNAKGTQIYSFEYFDMGYPLDVSSYDGQNARLGGILKEIDINKNLEPALKEGSGVTWYVRLNVKEGFIHYER